MSKKILEVINAEKYYGEKGNVTKALDDISFSVNEGEFLGIMGASGSGKTTLLNCISTIDKLSAGKVLINGENINGLKGSKLDAFRRDELGFIFQDFNLLDNMTAYENIALALSIQKVNHKEINLLENLTRNLYLSGKLLILKSQVLGKLFTGFSERYLKLRNNLLFLKFCVHSLEMIKQKV